jgi:hypothetical protein
MRSKVGFLLLTLALGALLAAPASSLARPKARINAPKASVRTLSGQVAGAGLPSGTRVAVPVLLDYTSRRRAKLRAPLAMLKLPRTATVRGPHGSRLTVAQLRIGDAFKAIVPVPRAARAAAYPAMNAVSTRFIVTRRGTALSADELQAEILALSGYVNALTAYVVAQFADLRGQVAALRGDLTSLQSAVNALKAQVDSLPLPTAVTTLITQVTQLETQLQTLTTQLNTATSDISTLAGKLTGIGPGDLADALSDVAALQALVGGVDVGALSGQLSALSSTVSSGDSNLQSQLNSANAALTTAQSQLAFLCSAGLVKGPLLSLSLVGTCP